MDTTTTNSTGDARADAALALQRGAKREADHVAHREGGSPYPFTRMRTAAQNALLVLGWDHTAKLVAEGEELLGEIVNGLSLAATRDTNTPAHRDRARAAMIQVMALRELVRAAREMR